MSEVRADVRLVAAVSRLVDLHQSRAEAAIGRPSVPDSAGRNLGIALAMLDLLNEREQVAGIGCTVSIDALLNAVQSQVPAATREDVVFCVRTLAQEREIHYCHVVDDGTPTNARTWDTTPLVDMPDGFEQVSLSDNGRLFCRVAATKESWLYSDLDAERLDKAIEREQFYDLPSFARAMVADLANKSRHLTILLERPALVELRQALITDGEKISESLSNSATTVRRAMDRIFEDTTKERFSRWRARTNAAISLGNLQAELEIVLRSVEALSRRFVQFLEKAQRIRGAGTERVRFLAIADHLVKTGSPTAAERLEDLLTLLLPPGTTAYTFHPGLVAGQVDLAQLRPTDDVPAPAIVDLSHGEPAPNDRLLDFIQRNREALVAALRTKPITFSDLMQAQGFTLLPGETPLDFFGLYSSPQLVDDAVHVFRVGLTGDKTTTVLDGLRVCADDPLLFMEEAPSQ